MAGLKEFGAGHFVDMIIGMLAGRDGTDIKREAQIISDEAEEGAFWPSSLKNDPEFSRLLQEYRQGQSSLP